MRQMLRYTPLDPHTSVREYIHPDYSPTSEYLAIKWATYPTDLSAQIRLLIQQLPCCHMNHSDLTIARPPIQLPDVSTSQVLRYSTILLSSPSKLLSRQLLSSLLSTTIINSIIIMLCILTSLGRCHCHPPPQRTARTEQVRYF